MQYNSHKQELKDRIKKAASEMFFKNGIRQVRMDDIAHNLGISKRTLYEIYDNKEQLLLDVVKYNNEENVKKLTDFANQGRTAIEIMAEFYRLQMKRVGNVNPCFLRIYKATAMFSTIFTRKKRRTESSSVNSSTRL